MFMESLNGIYASSMVGTDISMKWIGGATFILQTEDLKIACDPVLCDEGTVHNYSLFKSKRIEAPVYEKSDFDNIDLWLITHEHEDHLDKQGMAKISRKSRIICNSITADKLQKNNIKNFTRLERYETISMRFGKFDVTVEAIPAIHGVNPVSAFLAGKVNGYYVTISKGVHEINIYITGDTVFKNQVVQAMAGKQVDLMVPYLGAAQQGTWMMTLTLSARMLVKLIKEINPAFVVPVHYRAFEHYNEPIAELLKLEDSRLQIINPGESIQMRIENG